VENPDDLVILVRLPTGLTTYVARLDGYKKYRVERREKIKQLQEVLRDAGYDPGPIDGVMGEKTRSALAQQEADLAEKALFISSAKT
jgi:peptidoglycan hydrolase-like protein with peptidoglycan-binding domain